MNLLGLDERQQILNILKQWKENNGIFFFSKKEKNNGILNANKCKNLN